MESKSAEDWERQRARVRQLVARRMDPRARARFDASDVMQEAFLEAYERRAEGREGSDLSLFTWVRLLAQQKLVQLHRRHLGAQARDAHREERPGSGGRSDDSAAAETFEPPDASELGPSRLAAGNERRERVRAALAELRPPDREILELRHDRQMGNAEVARHLHLGEKTASMRYVRALARLRALLGPEDGESAP